ncbi:DUF2637 domain-containing protein [Streptomyces longisporoflavus]|uniref:DUF2637 domain-containing protein n=1 Tax=Streptomyces longisporoflavus TaxID=28044 RepID=UPI00167CD9A9|nr:DUF2637 domain-containing protein [Streptomyces longisporoflavus]
MEPADRGSQGTVGDSGTWEQPLAPLDPLDMHWDPEQELAHLLHEAAGNEWEGVPAPGGPVEAALAESLSRELLDELRPLRAVLPPRRRRARSRSRSRSRKRGGGALHNMSLFLAGLAAVVVFMVCVFGGMVSYDPLSHLARYRTSANAGWWPLLVYGPWLVASLSILRAALHRRRAVHSWAVVLVFSTVSMLLCVAQAPHTLIDAAAAALPAPAALACFQQLVRQITLTRPPRQANPRHRTRPRLRPGPPAASANAKKV